MGIMENIFNDVKINKNKKFMIGSMLVLMIVIGISTMVLYQRAVKNDIGSFQKISLMLFNAIFLICFYIFLAKRLKRFYVMSLIKKLKVLYLSKGSLVYNSIIIVCSIIVYFNSFYNKNSLIETTDYAILITLLYFMMNNSIMQSAIGEIILKKRFFEDFAVIALVQSDKKNYFLTYDKEIEWFEVRNHELSEDKRKIALYNTLQRSPQINLCFSPKSVQINESMTFFDNNNSSVL